MPTLTKSSRTPKAKRHVLHNSHKAKKPDLGAFAARCTSFMETQFAGRTIADSTPMLEELRGGGY